MRREFICSISCAVVLGLVGYVSAALPDGWSDRDIGTTGGSAGEAGGTWTVSGDGADVWGSSDAFHYVYIPLSGNGQITARVVSYGTGSNRWCKGGVMIRETLSTNSKHAMMAITGGEGGGLTFQCRPTTGGASYSSHDYPTASPPYWVKLQRESNTITGYSSADGVEWVQQPDGTGSNATGNPVDIAMADNVYVGLFVTSHAAGQVRTYTFDNVTFGGSMIALEPEPADGAIYPETWANLGWMPGSTAVSHDVYFGENFNDVETGAGGTFIGNQSSTSLIVGLPGFPYPDGLVAGKTYYWRVDEVEADGVTKYKGSVWSFFIPPLKAYDPIPVDGAKLVATDVTLTWTAGFESKLHTVYFGNDFDDVTNAAGGTRRSPTQYNPGALEFDKTYYWRVDEFDGSAMHKGDVWSFTTMPQELSSTTFYYVDGDNPDARDINPGTEARPFKTIRRGVQSLQPGDTLLIKAATYRETVILNRNGTRSRPIRIQAYPGDEGRAIIDAAEPVRNWRKCTGPADCDGNPNWQHIYVADVAALVDAHPNSEFAVRQVFQNGELLKRSRYPDVGWRYPTAVPDPSRTFTDSSLSRPDGYFTGSVCHIKTAVWHLDQIPVTGFSRGMVTLANNPRYDMTTRFGYYITSIVGEINEEGEWAYDPARKEIYLWPKGDVADAVEFTYRDYCIRTYDGASWYVVSGLALNNAYQYGIWLYRAHDMTVENNTIDHSFTFGIHLQSTGGTCNNNRILNNTIRHSAFRGITVGGDACYCRVEGNYVYATGVEYFGDDLMHGPSHGIYISGPFAQVYNNRIDRTGYTALYLDGHTLGREVWCNYITNVALSLSDGGGLYTGGFYGKSEKDHIHHNIFEDVIGCLSMDRNHDSGLPVTIEKYSGESSGIYVDEQGNNRIIEDNTVINSHMAGVFFHWAPGNVVQNNTLYGNRKAQIWFSGRNQSGDKLVDDAVLDNIMFATDSQQKTLYLGINYDDVHFGRSDGNYFYNPFNNWHIYVSRYNGQWVQDNLTLQRWRTMSGYDANSREFSYLDQFGDIAINPQKESMIVYNPSLRADTVDLESGKYCDVDGNKIPETITLQPFESKTLIKCDY